jgi:uncharacterized protein (UPF0261 family)
MLTSHQIAIGLGDGLPTVAPALPAPVQPSAAQIAADLAAAPAAYAARAARCQSYNQQMYLIAAGGAGLTALLLPGMWKLLAVVAGIGIVLAYPRSVDCDYGF